MSSRKRMDRSYVEIENIYYYMQDEREKKRWRVAKILKKDEMLGISSRFSVLF